eukprot:jgi/Chlat1/9284/Chrsp99S08539
MDDMEHVFSYDSAGLDAFDGSPLLLDSGLEGDRRAGSGPKSRRRGSYNCSKCGQPKKGHTCPLKDVPIATVAVTAVPCATPVSAKRVAAAASDCNAPARAMPNATREWLLSRPGAVVRPCMTVEDIASDLVDFDMQCFPGETPEPVQTRGRLSISERVARNGVHALSEDCLLTVLSSLSPEDLVAAGSVCKRWQDCTSRVWQAVTEAKLVVPAEELEGRSHVRRSSSSLQHMQLFVHRCPNLTNLTLLLDRHCAVNDVFLAQLASLRPGLLSFDVQTRIGAGNTITGMGLQALVDGCKKLHTLQVDGCSGVSSVQLSSDSLKTLWLGNCSGLAQLTLRCENLKELALDFTPHLDDSKPVSSPGYTIRVRAQLEHIMGQIADSCPSLVRLQVTAPLLHDGAIEALLDCDMSHLRMLSFANCPALTDEAIKAVAHIVDNLELLDVSGCNNLSDDALEQVRQAYHGTLTHLYVALCPEITMGGIVRMAEGMQCLQLLDCGFSLADEEDVYSALSPRRICAQSTPTKRRRTALDSMHHTEQEDQSPKKFKGEMHESTPDGSSSSIFHLKSPQLRKLSLWGCNRLQGVELNCPSLVDLNVTSCTGIEPGRVVLRCPKLKHLFAASCQPRVVDQFRLQANTRSNKRVRADILQAESPMHSKGNNSAIHDSKPCKIHT